MPLSEMKYDRRSGDDIEKEYEEEGRKRDLERNRNILRSLKTVI